MPNLKEKSGRVILAEFNSFPSHVVNKHTGLEDPYRLANVAMQGDIQAKNWELVCSEPLLVVDIINILRTYIWPEPKLF